MRRFNMHNYMYVSCQRQLLLKLVSDSTVYHLNAPCGKLLSDTEMNSAAVKLTSVEA